MTGITKQQKMRKRYILIFSSALMAMWTMNSCNSAGEKTDSDNGAATTEQGKGSSRVLSVATVTEGVMSDELILNGSVMNDESKVSKVFIPCSGKIQGVSVEVGDYV